MSLTVANRSLVSTSARATAAPKVVAAKPAVEPAPSSNVSALKVAHDTLAPGGLTVVKTAATAVGQAGAMGFTPPLIFDLIKSGIRSSLSVTNVAWHAVPSAFRNVRDAINGKVSAGRAAANVATDTTLGLAKNAGAFAGVQALTVAIGPVLGMLPISPAILPFVSIGVALGGLVGTYWVMNKVINKLGLHEKMSNGLTKLFGGDKPAPAPSTAKA